MAQFQTPRSAQTTTKQTLAAPPNKKHRGSSARAQLVESAQVLFWRNGVEATTPRQVLDHSGIGQGSLYHHFPTKKDLALTTISTSVADALGAAQLILVESSESAVQRIIDYLRRDRDALAGCRIGRLTSDPTVMSDQDLLDPVRDYFRGLLQNVEAVFIETGLSAELARARAITAVAVIQGGYVLSRALGDPTVLQEAITGFIALITAPVTVELSTSLSNATENENPHVHG